MSEETKYWVGKVPERCDICETELNPEDPPLLEPKFIDGKTVAGPWAIMCEECFNRYGIGIGTGKGQEYRLVSATNKWFKLKG